MTLHWVAALVAASLACNNPAAPGNDGSPDWPALPSGALAVPFELLASESTTGLHQPDRRVIDSQQAWAVFWRDFQANRRPQTDPPSVDFGSRVVLAAMMGERSTGGFSIEIAGVFRTDERLIVRVLETSPGPDCVVPQVITSPAVAVTIPRLDLPAEFIEGRATASCG